MSGGDSLKGDLPFILEGEGHTALSNMEAFSGYNMVLTTIPENQSCDFIIIKGDKKITVIIIGCRIRNFVSDLPIAIENKNALVQVITFIDKYENHYNYADSP